MFIKEFTISLQKKFSAAFQKQLDLDSVKKQTLVPIRNLASIALLLALSVGYTRAQSLEGCVMLNDTTPAAFATVYFPELGIGTTTDFEGRYLIEEIPQGVHQTEYSHLGFETAKLKLQLTENKRYAHDQRMQEQAIMLNEVYVTPNGEDPALYILKQVANQAKLNRKRLLNYDATIKGSIHAQDLDFIPELVPKMALWMIRKVIAMTGFGPIFDFCINHEKFTSHYSIVCHSKKGKTQYDGWHLISSTEPMPKEVEKALKKGCSCDPFDDLYGSIMSEKLKETNYKLKGTTEENGKIIDVLENENQYGTTTLYVVEGSWGILRKVFDGTSGLMVAECRDLGEGIYMPISFVDDPKTIDLNEMLLSEMQKIREKEADTQGKASKKEQKFFERLEEFANGERHFHPCLTESSTISYGNVQIAK